MENFFVFFDFIVEFLTRYQLTGILLLIILGILVFVGLSIVRHLGDMIGMRFWLAILPNKISDKHTLLSHKLFKKINYWLSSRLDNVNTDCDLRSALFADILKIRLKIMRDEYATLIDSEEYIKADDNELAYRVLGVIEKTYTKWHNECTKQGIPEFVLNQFEKHAYDFVSIFRKAVVSIFESDYPNYTKTEKIYHVLDIISSMEEWVISDLEKYLDTFNGEIIKLEYKNIKCKKCKLCAHDKKHSKL